MDTTSQIETSMQSVQDTSTPNPKPTNLRRRRRPKPNSEMPTTATEVVPGSEDLVLELAIRVYGRSVVVVDMPTQRFRLMKALNKDCALAAFLGCSDVVQI